MAKTNLRLISAVLFASDNPIKIDQISKLTNLPENEIEVDLSRLTKELNNLGLELINGPDGYELEVAHDLRSNVAKILAAQAQPLSAASLEVLTITAYEQPITKAGIDERRGIASDASLRTLLARDLIIAAGMKDGSPLYRTTNQFLKVLGLTNISELPPHKKPNKQNNSHLEND